MMNNVLGGNVKAQFIDSSLSARYNQIASRNEDEMNTFGIMSYDYSPTAHTRQIEIIEATIRAWKAGLVSSIQRNREYSRDGEMDFDLNTIFDFPPNEVRDVTIQVYKEGRGKLIAAFDLDDIEFVEPI